MAAWCPQRLLRKQRETASTAKTVAATLMGPERNNKKAGVSTRAVKAAQVRSQRRPASEPYCMTACILACYRVVLVIGSLGSSVPTSTAFVSALRCVHMWGACGCACHRDHP